MWRMRLDVEDDNERPSKQSRWRRSLIGLSIVLVTSLWLVVVAALAARLAAFLA